MEISTVPLHSVEREMLIARFTCMKNAMPQDPPTAALALVAIAFTSHPGKIAGFDFLASKFSDPPTGSKLLAGTA